MKTIFKFYLVLLIAITGCGKDHRIIPIDEELPPITTTGENTFGFLKNGEVWTPYLPFSLFPPGSSKLSVIYKNESGEIELRAGRTIPERNINEDIFLYSDSIFEIGTYHFISNHPLYIRDMTFFIDNSESIEKRFLLTNISDGELEISHYDTINYIISGMFNLILIDTINLDSIQITEGRFDVKYK